MRRGWEEARRNHLVFDTNDLNLWFNSLRPLPTELLFMWRLLSWAWPVAHLSKQLVSRRNGYPFWAGLGRGTRRIMFSFLSLWNCGSTFGMGVHLSEPLSDDNEPTCLPFSTCDGHETRVGVGFGG